MEAVGLAASALSTLHLGIKSAHTIEDLVSNFVDQPEPIVQLGKDARTFRIVLDRLSQCSLRGSSAVTISALKSHVDDCQKELAQVGELLEGWVSDSGRTANRLRKSVRTLWKERDLDKATDRLHELTLQLNLYLSLLQAEATEKLAASTDSTALAEGSMLQQILSQVGNLHQRFDNFNLSNSNNDSSPAASGIVPDRCQKGKRVQRSEVFSTDDPMFVAMRDELRRCIEELSRQSPATPPTGHTSNYTEPARLITPPLPLLLVAAISPNTEELERTIRATPDINIREESAMGRNALHMAAIFDLPRNVSLLLRSGVDKHATTDRGLTALMAACTVGSRESIKVLLEEGDEDPNQRDSSQNTPLHAAAVNCHSGVVRELLDHGADPFARTVDGWMPLNVAVHKKDAQTVQILTEAMESNRT